MLDFDALNGPPTPEEERDKAQLQARIDQERELLSQVGVHLESLPSSERALYRRCAQDRATGVLLTPQQREGLQAIVRRFEAQADRSMVDDHEQQSLQAILTLLRDWYPQPIAFSQAELARIARTIVQDFGPGLEEIGLGPADIQTVYIVPASERGVTCQVMAFPWLVSSREDMAQLPMTWQRDPDLPNAKGFRIGQLTSNNSRLNFLDPDYASLAPDLVGAMAGTRFVYVPESVRARRDALYAERRKAANSDKPMG